MKKEDWTKKKREELMKKKLYSMIEIMLSETWDVAYEAGRKNEYDENS